MVVWRECKQLGIAVCHYRPGEKETYHMPVCVGDTIYLLEEDGEWYRGYLINDRQVKGIVPKKYVHIKESTPIRIGNYESLSPQEPLIVQEITAVLREWGALVRLLFVNNKQKDYKLIREMMKQLMTLRRELMSKKLTKDDFGQKQLEATAKIDYGNMLLGLDLTVRDAEGGVINSENIGVIELFNNHRETVKRNAQRRRQPDSRATQKHSLNLFITICNVICRVGDEADVIMALYDPKQAKFFSENYIIRWSQKGMPKDLDLLNNLKVLFSDLGSKDLSSVREKVYLVCQVVRLGGMAPPENEGKPVKVKNILRRPFGVAALDVTSILNGDICPDEDKQHFVPIVPCQGKNDFMETVIKEAVKAEEITQRIHKGQGIWVSVRLLDGDIKQVREAYPHLIVGPTIVARKMGFPEVIMPSDVRNDFYVTINLGDFGQGRLADRNVQISMQVCSRDGKPLAIRKDSLNFGRQSLFETSVEDSEITENVISMGGGAELQSVYKSVVYKHQDSPRWYETFKIAVPIEEFYNCHLKFTFKHISGSEAKDGKPFAISHVSFISADQTTLADGDHNLLVYSMDTKKSSDALAYLSLPSMVSEIDRDRGEKDKSSKLIGQGPYTLAKNNSFQITTLACSTKLTHNVDLLSLLNWKAKPDALPVHLRNLMKVDGEEIVKFLQHTLDALFAILMQNSESGTYDNMVFDALIFVIGLIGDRKYLQFQSVLELYIKENFHATLAYTKLTMVLKHYVDDVDIPDSHDTLYRSFKSIVYLMKIIIRSWLLFAKLNDNKGSVQFQVSIKQLFTSIADLMKLNTAHTLKIQGAALKFMPGIIPDMVNEKAMDRTELAGFFILMIQNIPQERLSKQKLVCILDIVNSPLFKFTEPRQKLMEMMVEHINDEISSSTKDPDICAKIIADMVHQTYTINSAREDLKLLFRPKDLLRTIIQSVITMDRKNELAQDYTAIMIAILRQMTDAHYTLYLQGIPDHQNLFEFLAEIIMVFQDLIKECVFPSDWNEMIMVQNQVFLKALRCFSHTIKEKFSTPFKQQLWNNFFHCAISFLTQDALQLENFSSCKRRKIIARYADMRRAMGFEIRAMWLNLGQHKIRFIPELVGPILEMTLLPEIELRKATLPIFFDMMQCEYYQMVHRSQGAVMNGNFHQFENELITQMDVQVEGGHGDEQYIELFYVAIHQRCASHQVMRDLGIRFVEVIKKLLMRLLEYRTIIHDENKDNRMNCIVNLLNFYKDIERQELYIRYLHKLCDLHLECQNYTEAACTLMLYTKLLRWSDDHLESLLRSDNFPSAQTHRELKELLYLRVIDHLDQGKMWEKGIELCKELIAEYEYEVFDYQKLTAMLRKQAEFYNKIQNETRHPPAYYRVSYYGNGFPSFLSNKTFVHRGREFEMLADFSVRVREPYPDAKVLTTLNNPNHEILESAGQFLQMNAVNPVFEPLQQFVGKNVSEQILKYWKFNEVDRFTYSRPLKKTDDIADMWLERTDLTTESPLPGILRWFPVKNHRTSKVSPLENAIESMDTTNSKLQIMIEEHDRQKDLQINPLSMLLNGICDAAVNGGLSNYKPFFSPDYNDRSESQPDSPSSHVEQTGGAYGYQELQRIKKERTELVYKLKNLITQQLVLLAQGLTIHDDKCPESLRPFHDNMIEQYNKLSDYVQSEYKIAPPQGVINLRRQKSNALQFSTPKSGSFSNFGQAGEAVVTRKSSTPDKLSRTPSVGTPNPKSVMRQSNSSPGKVGHAKSSRGSARVASNYSTDSKDSGDSAEKKAEGPVIELNQTAKTSNRLVQWLTSARPPRPESKSASKSRPSSGNSKSALQAQISLPTFLNGANNQAPCSAASASHTSLNITTNVYIESPLARPASQSSGRVAQSPPFHSGVEPEAGSGQFFRSSISSNDRPAISLGYNSVRWESSGSLPTMDSFDDASDRSSTLQANSRLSGLSGLSSASEQVSTNKERLRVVSAQVNAVMESSSTPPPLPRKQSQIDCNADNMYAAPHSVKMRHHSHKGKPPPALPPVKPGNQEGDVPPALPDKRTSLGSRSNTSN
ncbi:dedicator of cytokinesis protein 1-like [Watersipora subatra]|uniref:dedicator of cytokinesis protein 1-like n=1 Tax=Watersipora subatra TaxID=2589382 RepID=UPI00355C9163